MRSQSLLRSFVMIGLVLIGACGDGGVAEESDCASDGFAGYLHTYEASRFQTGENATYEADPEWERWIGNEGVFFIGKQNGVARGIMNAGSPALQLPSLAPEEVHDQESFDYFANAGLPRCQIGTVERWSIGGLSGSWQISVLRRSFVEIPIVESIASVRWNSSRQSVSETVHWPRISGEVLEEALRIRDASTQAQSILLINVSNMLGSEFEVLGPAIRHSNAASTGSFVEVAVLQVQKDGVLYNFDLSGELVLSISSSTR
jgi:hypothetical protein